jgi:hypothetical protein
MKMTHYGFPKNFFRKQNKETLEDWGEKLITLYERITNSKPFDISEMTKNELVDFCYSIIDDIIDSKISNYSSFFWNDGGSGGVSEYIYETIIEHEKGNDNDLIDEFIDSDYCKPIFENEIKKYKIQWIYLELFDNDHDSSFETTKEQIIAQWNKYMLVNEKVELFENENDPILD